MASKEDYSIIRKKSYNLLFGFIFIFSLILFSSGVYAQAYLQLPLSDLELNHNDYISINLDNHFRDADEDYYIISYEKPDGSGLGLLYEGESNVNDYFTIRNWNGRLIIETQALNLPGVIVNIDASESDINDFDANDDFLLSISPGQPPIKLSEIPSDIVDISNDYEESANDYFVGYSVIEVCYDGDCIQANKGDPYVSMNLTDDINVTLEPDLNDILIVFRNWDQAQAFAEDIEVTAINPYGEVSSIIGSIRFNIFSSPNPIASIPWFSVYSDGDLTPTGANKFYFYNTTVPVTVIPGEGFSTGTFIYLHDYFSGTIDEIYGNVTNSTGFVHNFYINESQQGNFGFQFHENFTCLTAGTIGLANNDFDLPRLAGFRVNEFEPLCELYFDIHLSGNDKRIKLNTFLIDIGKTITEAGDGIIQIASIAPVTLSPTDTEETLNFNDFFIGYTNISLSSDTIDPPLTLGIDEVNGNSLATSDFTLELISFNNSIFAYFVKGSTSVDLQETITVTAFNEAEQVETNFTFVISKTAQSSSQAGSNNYIGTIANYVEPLFPDSDSLSLSQRMIYVFVVFIITIVLLGFALRELDSFSFIGYLGVFLLAVEFIFFLAIGYIPVSALILIVLIGLAIAYFKVKGGGG
jgi:hypothetical protein